MSDIRLKKITIESLQSPLIIQAGDVNITSTTASTSVLDGALVINGGASINTTYESSSSTSGGALTIAGGVGIMKGLYIGKDLTLDSSNGVFSARGLIIDRLFLDTISNKNFYIAPDGVNKRLDLSDTNITFYITTPSTNSTSGALCINGGISVSCTNDSTDASNGGAVTIAGGMAIGKTLSVAKELIIGETDSNNSAINIRYTGQDQILLQNNSSGAASINVENTNLILDNTDDIILQTHTGEINFINDAENCIKIRKDNTEFLHPLYISNTTTSTTSSTGSLILNGGISIVCTSDSTSETSGGSFTTLGGLAILKKIITGDSVNIKINADKKNKINLWKTDYDLSNDNQFTGFGTISSGSLVYQVNDTSGNHIFYSGLTNISSDEIFRICGNRDIIFSGLDQKYIIKGGGLTNDSLSFESQSGPLDVNYFAKSGKNLLSIFASGTPNDVANSELLQLGWDNNSYILSNNAFGTGSLYDIILSTGTIGQMVIQTNGCVSITPKTSSINSSTGALCINGGLSIDSTENAVNVTNGGSLTLAGGASILKDTYIGGELVLGSGTKLSSDITNTSFSSLIVTTLQNYHPNLQLKSDAISEYPVSIEMYSLGDSSKADNQSFQLGSDDIGSFIKTVSNGSGQSKPILMHTNTNVSQLVLQTSGNVGINNSTPQFNLHVDGTFCTNDLVLFTSSVDSVNSTFASVVVQGGVSISNTIDSSSVTRGGALTVAGGVSVAKSMFVGGITEFLDTTPSTSVLQASVIVHGGLSIKSGENAVGVLNGGGLTVAGGGAFSGDLYVGGSINGSGSSSSTYAYLTLTATDEAINLSSGSLISLGGITLQSDRNSSNISNGGSFLTPGGASIGKDVYIGGDLKLTNGVLNCYSTNNAIVNFYDVFNIRRFSIDKSSSTENFSVTRYDALGNIVERTFEITNTNGDIAFNNTVSSSNKDTASVVFKGGVSISQTTNAISLQNGGSLTIAGGASIEKDVYVGGDIKMLSTTESESSSTGSLILSGGLGIGGNLNVKGNTVIVGNLTVNGQTTTVETTNTSIKDNLLLLNSGPTGTNDSGFVINRYQTDNNIGSGDVVADNYPPETFTIPDQTGMTTIQLKLPNIANAINNYYRGWWIKMASGFSNNQVRRIESYDGTTKIVVLSSVWSNQNPSIGDAVMLYNKPYVGVIYNETNDRFEFGCTVDNPDQSSVILTDKIPICYSSATSVSTTVSTSVSNGALLMSGGISICNTNDSQSITSGGTITTLGGASIGKTLRVGDTLYVNGSNMTPSPYDMFSVRTFSAANNQNVFTNITGLLFDNNVWGFDIYLSINLVATTNLYTNFHIRGVNKSSEWEIIKTYVGSDTGIEFDITNFGQIRYTTPNYTGFSSLTFHWRALTT